jgi:hypothetical protein
MAIGEKRESRKVTQQRSKDVKAKSKGELRKTKNGFLALLGLTNTHELYTWRFG